MIAPGLLHHCLAPAEHARRLEGGSHEVRARALGRLTDYLFARVPGSHSTHDAGSEATSDGRGVKR
jgi:hypothetical protein